MAEISQKLRARSAPGHDFAASTIDALSLIRAVAVERLLKSQVKVRAFG